MKLVTISDDLKQGAFNYILRLVTQKLLGLLFFLLGSGWVMGLKAWIFFVLYFLSALVIIPVYRVNPEILVQRGKVITDSPLWDKILLVIYWLLDFFIVYLIAGIEAAGTAVLPVFFWAGIVLFLMATAISLGAVMVNPYLESTARIQSERDQRVVSRGVYGLVRHPAYLAVLLFCLARLLIFMTPLTGATLGVIAVLIIIRTYLEDGMLLEGLEGYEEYSRKTKYRLVPFLW